jgi:hypothetical protein
MSSKRNITEETLKTLRAIHFGRNISVTEPVSAPYFFARFVKGHCHWLNNNTNPSTSIAQIASNKIQLKVLVMTQ